MAAVNMTEGSITKHLVDYSIPLILGNMFQLTYNAVDSIIAGRFIGKEALAAEGTASPVMNIVILGISGICMGASVLMSEFYGAGQKEKLKREMSTTVIFGCYFSVIIAILGGFFSESLLGALGVPDEILGKAASYLSVIFLGAPIVTIRLVADLDILYERQRARDLDDTRHPGHIAGSFHKGDILQSRDEQPCMVGYEEFINRCTNRGYGTFALGMVFELNVTDFSRTDYPALMQKLNRILR